jgi:hypothetical protein
MTRMLRLAGNPRSRVVGVDGLSHSFERVNEEFRRALQAGVSITRMPGYKFPSPREV